MDRCLPMTRRAVRRLRVRGLRLLRVLRPLPACLPVSLAGPSCRRGWRAVCGLSESMEGLDLYTLAMAGLDWWVGTCLRDIYNR